MIDNTKYYIIRILPEGGYYGALKTKTGKIYFRYVDLPIEEAEHFNSKEETEKAIKECNLPDNKKAKIETYYYL